MSKVLKSPLFYFVVLILVVWGTASVIGRRAEARKFSFNDWVARMDAGEVKSVKVYPQGTRI